MTASDRSDPVLRGLDGILADLEDFYKDLHANPELSMQEERTSRKAAERLEASGFEVTRGVGNTLRSSLRWESPFAAPISGNFRAS